MKASKNPLSTGQTGAAVLGGSLLATAVSKEMVVLDADVSNIDIACKILRGCV